MKNHWLHAVGDKIMEPPEIKSVTSGKAAHLQLTGPDSAFAGWKQKRSRTEANCVDFRDAHKGSESSQ